MLKILCMSYEYPPIGGGGANVARPLVKSLTSQGHEIEVVTSGMGDLPAQQKIDGINVHRVRCRRRHRHYTTTAELMTYIMPAYRKAMQLSQRHDFDINHTHFALPTGLVSYLLYKKTGLPYVTTIHGSDIPGYNPDRFRIAHALVRPIWRQVIANSAKIVSASHFLKGLIQSHIDVPVEIVPNGFASGFTAGVSQAKTNRILVVTRMFRRKGVQHFLEAIAGLDHNWEVVIAGDGPYLPVLKEQARRGKINARFVGYVQGDSLAELYATSKIFVFPSIQENFPTVLLEAMEAGCAIVTTSSEGCGEVIGDAGITTLPERPDQIREALVSLMSDETKIARLSALARERVRCFRWPRIAAQYEQVLNDAVAHRSDAALDETITATFQVPPER